MTAAPILLIGYGNPGRGDDGLGPELARRIEARALPGLTVEIDYQLSVDHALLIAGFPTVIFADATMECAPPFSFHQIEGVAAEGLGSHSVSPSAALALAGLLFGATSRGYVLALGGHSFGEVAEGLSPVAQDSLDQAEAFFLDWYRRAQGHGAGGHG